MATVQNGPPVEKLQEPARIFLGTQGRKARYAAEVRVRYECRCVGIGLLGAQSHQNSAGIEEGERPLLRYKSARDGTS